MTTDPGSKLLYYGDIYAGKLSPPMDAEILRRLNEFEQLQEAREADGIVLQKAHAKIGLLERVIDELNEAAIDAGDLP